MYPYTSLVSAKAIDSLGLYGGVMFMAVVDIGMLLVEVAFTASRRCKALVVTLHV